MALTVPAHRIQTIHGVFGSPSWSSILPASGASHSLEMSSFNSIPNTSLTSLRGRGSTGLSVLAARSAAPSASASLSSPHTPVVTRPRRSSIHGRTTIVPVVEDPFADNQDYIVETLPPPRAQTRTTQSFARTQLAPQRRRVTCTLRSRPDEITSAQRGSLLVYFSAGLAASQCAGGSLGSPFLLGFRLYPLTQSLERTVFCVFLVSHDSLRFSNNTPFAYLSYHAFSSSSTIVY
ncbi:hypothetical protein BC629DRAFT_667759 [Irpex lacteus]|nr:hypothetical protein BC629DRAFT_667759 [Irpex lacteus]